MTTVSDSRGSFVNSLYQCLKCDSNTNSKLLKSFICMVGVSYNLTVISVVETLLRYRYGSIDTFVTSSLDTTMIMGIIIGMLVFG